MAHEFTHLHEANGFLKQGKSIVARVDNRLCFVTAVDMKRDQIKTQSETLKIRFKDIRFFAFDNIREASAFLNNY